MSLKTLLSQREELDRLIQKERREARSAALAQIRTIMAEYGLTAQDFASDGRARRPVSGSQGSKVPAKYRHPTNGKTWSGRGLKPKWLVAELNAGKDIKEFAI